MKRKIIKMLTVASLAFVALFVAACGSGSIEGTTWYRVGEGGNLETLTFEEGGIVYDEDGDSGAWVESDNVVTVSSALGSETLAKNEDGTLSPMDSEEPQVYYSEQEQAEQIYEEARRAAIEQTNKQAEPYIADAKSRLIGTWRYEGDYYDSSEIAFKEDGTWIAEGVFGGQQKRFSGTWEIAYEGEETEFQGGMIAIHVYSADGEEFNSWGQYRMKAYQEDGLPSAGIYDDPMIHEVGEVWVVDEDFKKVS